MQKQIVDRGMFIPNQMQANVDDLAGRLARPEDAIGTGFYWQVAELKIRLRMDRKSLEVTSCAILHGCEPGSANSPSG